MKLVVIAAAAVVLMASSSGGQVMAASEAGSSAGPAATNTGPSAKAQSTHEAETEASRKALEGFVNMLAKGDVRGAFEQYTTETYTQHMTGVRPGREGAIAHIEEELARGAKASLLGFIADGNMVAIHMRQKFTDGSPEREVIEMWRVENGRLAEHWGVDKNIQ